MASGLFRHYATFMTRPGLQCSNRTAQFSSLAANFQRLNRGNSTQQSIRAAHGQQTLLSTSIPRHTSQMATSVSLSRPMSSFRLFTGSALNIENLLLRFRSSLPTRMRQIYFNNESGGSHRPPLRGPGPWEALKRRINGIHSDVIFWSIIGINVVVFGISAYALNSAQRFGDYRLVHWMSKNFLSTWKNFSDGRYWTLVTSCFAHLSVSHILFNGIAFYFFAPSMLMLLSNVQFLTVYLGGGILANLFSLGWKKWRGRSDGSAGASGAIYSLLTFYACHSPRTKFLLYFFIPMPAWLLVSGIFAWDLYGAVTNRSTTTDSAGHVGGILSGVLIFLRMTGRLPF